ncbi:hypothetical protein LZ198_06905 [Myxococcus sp. K15C18031901]|uniref:hypothetical protein n=1 Tax=Myxococcus dinghuensis TaxID=2906761 RepID=UPI0020A825B9|nr:hypothetical protein [Myxococcus dinghuensis]MCP3098603.1 hypothetical protein [Myxococcus dinghuensis]
MRLPMAVMMCAALSFLGCGAPEADESSEPVTEDTRTVSEFATCSTSGLPACSLYSGKSCSPLYSRLACCNGTNTDELVCSTNGVTTALTWQFW